MTDHSKHQHEGHTRAKCLGTSCGGCRHKTHRSNAYPNKARWDCISCGGIGHAQWECTELLCTLCKGYGHSSIKCANRERWFCRKCASFGHGFWECGKGEKVKRTKNKTPYAQPKCLTCGRHHPTSSCLTRLSLARASNSTSSTATFNPGSSRSPKIQQSTNQATPYTHSNEQVTKLVVLGDQWMYLKNYYAATPCFTTALDLDSSNGHIHARRGIAYALLKRDSEAISDLNLALEDASYVASVEFYIHLARCRLRSGSFITAMHALRDAKSLDPHHPAVCVLQGRLEDLERFRARYESTLAAGNWRAAKVALESCLDIYKAEFCQVPTEVQRWRIELMIHEGARLEEAEHEVEKLLEDEHPPEILFLSALVAFLRDRLAGCMSRLMAILVSDPDNSEAQRLRSCVEHIISCRKKAAACVWKENWLESRQEYTEAHKAMKPYEHWACGGTLRANLSRARATVLEEMHQYEEAIKDANVCLSILPEDFEAIYLRGRAFTNLELYDSAAIDLTVASKKAPMNMEGIIQAQLKAVDLKRKQPKDFYKILGLTTSCSKTEIKRAYRAESLKHHPDKGGLPERFRAVSDAYETLSDDVKRAAYDYSRSLLRSSGHR